MSYKYKEKIEEQLNADPIQLALDNEWEKAFEELDEVYNKAAAWDIFYISIDSDIQENSETIKEYKKAGLDTSDYEMVQEMMVTIKRELDALKESNEEDSE